MFGKMFIFGKYLLLLVIISQTFGMPSSHEGGMMRMRKMLKEQMESCLDIDFPKEFKQHGIKCASEMFRDQSSPFVNQFLGESFPDKSTISSFFREMLMCKHQELGTMDDDGNFNSQNIIEMAKIDEWSGEEEDIQIMRSILEDCSNKVSEDEDSANQIVHLEKCLTNQIIEHCKNEDDDVGMALPLMSKMLVLEEDFGCSSVQVPSEVEEMCQECMDETESNMGEVPEKIQSISDPMKKMKMLMKRFMKNFTMPMGLCLAKRLNFLDESTMECDYDTMAEYVGNMEGWEDDEKKQMVVDGITQCGDMAKAEVEEDENETMEEESEETMEGSMMRGHKKMMKMKMKFMQCFSPIYANACGMNNDLADFLFPVFNQQLMTKLGEKFRQTGGDEVQDVLEMVKVGMRSPKFFDKLESFM